MTTDLLKKFKKANRLAKYKLKMAFARIESETNKKFNQQTKQCDKRLAKLKQEKKESRRRLRQIDKESDYRNKQLFIDDLETDWEKFKCA